MQTSELRKLYELWSFGKKIERRTSKERDEKTDLDYEKSKKMKEDKKKLQQKMFLDDDH